MQIHIVLYVHIQHTDILTILFVAVAALSMFNDKRLITFARRCVWRLKLKQEPLETVVYVLHILTEISLRTRNVDQQRRYLTDTAITRLSDDSTYSQILIFFSLFFGGLYIFFILGRKRGVSCFFFQLI